MAKSASIRDVETHFEEWVQRAEAGEPVVITRQGKPVVALVPASEVESEAPKPKRGLASLVGGWEGSDEFVERVAEIRRSPPRDVLKLD